MTSRAMLGTWSRSWKVVRAEKINKVQWVACHALIEIGMYKLSMKITVFVLCFVMTHRKKWSWSKNYDKISKSKLCGFLLSETNWPCFPCFTFQTWSDFRPKGVHSNVHSNVPFGLKIWPCLKGETWETWSDCLYVLMFRQSGHLYELKITYNYNTS